MSRWVCTKCGHEAEGVNPPKKCTCGASKDSFEIMEERAQREPGEEMGGSEDDEWEEDIEVDDDFD
ncbi:hypothetical protein HY639_02270 [Candidatus Woesearchaeota archaeon]|nr:hypothetical protein [Candidatus Woesearchaeota archaeon]